MKVLTVENTSKEIDDSGVDTAILPIGAIEQHGPHLPLGTDWIVVQEVAKKVAEKMGDCYLLPAMPYGNSQEHMGFSGTVTLRPSTLANVIRDVVLSLKLHGVKKIIVISGHGGNWIIKPTIRELNLEYPDLKIIHGGPMGKRPADMHAGESETSSVLYLNEELVKKDKIVDSSPDATQEYLDYVGMKGVSKHGNWGRASQASKEKGEQGLEARADRIFRYAKETLSKLDEIERANPRRSIIPKPNEE
ncbi:MAG: creatininase family protein [Candidatus Bathyarchaeota archaeon]|nr:creatininase family protein [Candidatus Bathyarchaeota archaeon]